MEFDGDSDGTFGESGDNVKPLVDEALTVMARDATSATDVRITATDSAGRFGYNTYTILNIPPSLAADNATVTVDEGQTAATSGTYSDPGNDTLTLAASVGTVTDNGDGTWSWSFDTSDGPDESQTVTITATDSDGAATSISFDLTVNNVAPVVGPITAPTDPVLVNTQITASADFTDPGVVDAHTATWDWGDGSMPSEVIIENDGSWSVTGNHTYTLPGVYTVELIVEDDDGGSDTAVFEYVVVYDPDGGFVTGGGWINSLEGTHAYDSALTGKATFGFVSKYKKGAAVPTGNTQFVFKAADLNFHSSSYDWLVVTGSNYARYKGSGTINDGLAPNGTEYRFMLWAGDGTGSGGEDTFRIKIWYEKDGDETVVYDNGMDQPISRGSIVVHE